VHAVAVGIADAQISQNATESGIRSSLNWSFSSVERLECSTLFLIGLHVELLARYLPDLRSPIYYCAGPHGMTMAMAIMLGDLGVADDDIRSEEFYGY
jgi:ferredoxin-NADP reductase